MHPRDFELIQPIIVPRSGTHEGIIMAVARASYLAYATSPQSPTWRQWLAEAPAKSVRKVKAPSHVDQVRTWAESEGIAHAFVDGVLALVPTTYEGMHRRVRGSQVHGVDFPSAPREQDSDPEFEVVVLDGLSTGKAAAQAAHALWGWHLTNPAAPLDAPFEVVFRSARDLDDLSGRGTYQVRDAGFTEVSPGTLTALARGSARN